MDKNYGNCCRPDSFGEVCHTAQICGTVDRPSLMSVGCLGLLESHGEDPGAEERTGFMFDEAGEA